VPVAINQLGQVVAMVTAQGECRHSFLVDDQGVRDIIVSDGHACTRVNDINDAGFVVGTVDTPPQPFLWHEGVATLLSGVSGVPVAINNSNQVVFDSGLLWEAGQVTELTLPESALLTPVAMNNAAQIVGTSNAPPYGTYLWHAGNALELPIGPPFAINDHGHVLGLKALPDPQSPSGLATYVGIWDGAQFLPHTSVTDVRTSRLGLNNADEIAGTREEFPGDFPPTPFIGTVSQFTRLSNMGAAFDLNDRGDVIGQAYESHRSPINPIEVFFSPGAGRIWSRTCSLACCP
jgi:hypothetical protein